MSYDKDSAKKNSKVKNSFGTLPKPENSKNGECIKQGCFKKQLQLPSHIY